MSERLRLAWVSPLPPATSGIADYSADLLGALAAESDLALFYDGGEAPGREIAARFDCRPVGELDGRAASAFDLVVWQIGNSAPHHAASYRKAIAIPGVVVLHETMLHHLVRGMTLVRGDAAGYREEMRYAAGRSGELAAQRLLDTHYPVDTWSFPLFERLVDRSVGVIVHNRFARERVLASRPRARVERVPMGIDLERVRPVSAAERAATRARLGVAAGEFVVASFGFVTPQKRLEPVLAAFARLRAEKLHAEKLRADSRRARFVIVGEVSPHYDLDELLARTGRDGVEVLGRAEAATFDDWMNAADLAVNLRHPTGGETSASLLRLLAFGRPTVVNRTGSFAEVPDGACLQVPLDAFEEATLEAIFRRAFDDPPFLAGIGAAARRFVEAEHSLAASARAYLAALESFARSPAMPLAAVPPLAPWPGNDPWPALLSAVGAELADLGLGEGDEELLATVAERLTELR
jgi:glycosyltransferase involved in cell wall biosynthesis